MHWPLFLVWNVASQEMQGLYYYPGVIGVDPLKDSLDLYDEYYKRIHIRDLPLISRLVKTIRISGQGVTKGSDRTPFLDLCAAYNLSVIPSFTFHGYNLIEESVLDTSKQIVDDFEAFMAAHDHAAVSTFIVGDVTDFLEQKKTSQWVQSMMTPVGKVLDAFHGKKNWKHFNATSTLHPSIRPISISIFNTNMLELMITTWAALSFDNWVFTMIPGNVGTLQAQIHKPPAPMKGHGMMVHLTLSAWSLLEHGVDETMQSSCLTYLFDFFHQNKIFYFAMEWSDQWWRSSSVSMCSEIARQPYAHSFCKQMFVPVPELSGGLFSSQDTSDDFFIDKELQISCPPLNDTLPYLDSGEYLGLNDQFNRWGMHCIRARPFLLDLARNAMGVNVSVADFEESCVFLFPTFSRFWMYFVIPPFSVILICLFFVVMRRMGSKKQPQYDDLFETHHSVRSESGNASPFTLPVSSSFLGIYEDGGVRKSSLSGHHEPNAISSDPMTASPSQSHLSGSPGSTSGSPIKPHKYGAVDDSDREREESERAAEGSDEADSTAELKKDNKREKSTKKRLTNLAQSIKNKSKKVLGKLKRKKGDETTDPLIDGVPSSPEEDSMVPGAKDPASAAAAAADAPEGGSVKPPAPIVPGEEGSAKNAAITVVSVSPFAEVPPGVLTARVAIPGTPFSVRTRTPAGFFPSPNPRIPGKKPNHEKLQAELHLRENLGVVLVGIDRMLSHELRVSKTLINQYGDPDATNDADGEMLVHILTVHERMLEGYFCWLDKHSDRKIEYIGTIEKYKNNREAVLKARKAAGNPKVGGLSASADGAVFQLGPSCNIAGPLGVESLYPSKSNIPPARELLYPRIVLFRLLTLLCEHIVHCPERLCMVFHKILLRMDNLGTFVLDVEDAQRGLELITAATNLDDINFDDINDCGAQNLDTIHKTFYESQGMAVLLDILRNYNQIFFFKAWIFCGAIWIRALSFGVPADPEAFWTTVVMVDSAIYWALEMILATNAALQERKFPMENAPHSLLALLLFLWVYLVPVSVIPKVVVYFVFRVLFSIILSSYILNVLGWEPPRRIAGRLDKEQHKVVKKGEPAGGAGGAGGEPHESRKVAQLLGQARADQLSRLMPRLWPRIDAEPFVFWLVVFSLTVVAEVYLVAPIGIVLGFDMCNTQCPSTSSGIYSNVCTACRLSVVAIYGLMCITMMIDTPFAFSLVLSIVGYFKGQRRKIHNVFSSESCRVDLTANGHRRSLASLFGPWERFSWPLWNATVQDLRNRDLICSLDLRRLQTCSKKWDFSTLNKEARERLSFFLATTTSMAATRQKEETLKQQAVLRRRRRDSTPIVAAPPNATPEKKSKKSTGDDSRDKEAKSKREEQRRKVQFLQTVPRISHVITCFNESVMLSAEYLQQRQGKLSNLELLISQGNYAQEWNFFQERFMTKHPLFRKKQVDVLQKFLGLHLPGLLDEAEREISVVDSSYGDNNDEVSISGVQPSSPLHRPGSDHAEGQPAEPPVKSVRLKAGVSFSRRTEFYLDLIEEVRIWASTRSQTLFRTVRGAITYHDSIRIRYESLKMPRGKLSSSNSTTTSPWGSTNDLAGLDSDHPANVFELGELGRHTELILAHQTYAIYPNKGAIRADIDDWRNRRNDVDWLMHYYADYPILLIYDYVAQTPSPLAESSSSSSSKRPAAIPHESSDARRQAFLARRKKKKDDDGGDKADEDPTSAYSSAFESAPEDGLGGKRLKHVAAEPGLQKRDKHGIIDYSSDTEDFEDYIDVDMHWEHVVQRIIQQDEKEITDYWESKMREGGLFPAPPGASGSPANANAKSNQKGAAAKSPVGAKGTLADAPPADSAPRWGDQPWFKYMTVVKRVVQGELRVISVMPRRYPYRLGSGSHQTNGKSANQINALRLVSGHIIQVSDANMDGFIGEGFKLPFVARMFHGDPFDTDPIKQPTHHEDSQQSPKSSGGPSTAPTASPALLSKLQSRKSVKYRIIGFREFIYTDMGMVGSAMASSEFTFGTIFQRVLADPLGVRMHYGHPDFFDSFWVINRGGLSKASSQINLSEDVFAGYNVQLRGENITHVDMLEWQKGRETVLTSASQFLTKISAGAMGMLRSRDMAHIQTGLDITTRLSLFYGGVGSYIFQLLVDCTIILYVLCFFLLSLGSVSRDDVGQLHSSIGAEWLLSFGFVSLFPLLMEMMLEHGWGSGLLYVLKWFPFHSVFYLFQNKTVASTLKYSIRTGEANYVATGRPNSFDHYSKKLAYRLYAHSHYYPALVVLTLYVLYRFFLDQEGGAMPMILVLSAAGTWLVGPVLFCPQKANLELLKQDVVSCYTYLLTLTDMGSTGDTPKTGGWTSPVLDSGVSMHAMWREHNRKMYAPDKVWSQAVYFLGGVGQVALLLSVAYSSLTDYSILYMFGWLAHFASCVLWYVSRYTNFVSCIWIAVPFILYFILPGLTPFHAGGPEALFGLLLFYMILSCLHDYLLLSLSLAYKLFARCYPQQKKEFKKVYDAWLDVLFFVCLQYHFHLYSGLFVVTIQFVTNLGLAILAAAFELVSSGLKVGEADSSSRQRDEQGEVKEMR